MDSLLQDSDPLSRNGKLAHNINTHTLEMAVALYSKISFVWPVCTQQKSNSSLFPDPGHCFYVSLQPSSTT